MHRINCLRSICLSFLVRWVALIGLIWNGFSLRVSVFITSILLLWKQDKYAIFFDILLLEVQSPRFGILPFGCTTEEQELVRNTKWKKSTNTHSLTEKWENICSAYNALSFREHKKKKFAYSSKISIIYLWKKFESMRFLALHEWRQKWVSAVISAIINANNDVVPIEKFFL